MELYIVFFKPGDKEGIPALLENEIYCEVNGDYVYFISLDSYEDAQKSWESIKDWVKDIKDKIFIYSFFHKPVAFEDLRDDIREFSNTKIFVPYSSSDPLYNEIWNQIHTAENCQKLISILQFWIRNHVVDPIRLVKHRSLNLFSHISYDLQTLVRLIDEKDYSELEKVANEIVQSWKSVDATHSPKESLRKLWCYLVGRNLSSLNCDKYGLIYIGQKKMTLLQWLLTCSEKHSIKEEILFGEPWNKLIQLCGLKELPNRNFAINRSSKIVRLCKQIEKQVTNPINHQGVLRQHSIDIMEWMNQINLCFEELHQEILIEK